MTERGFFGESRCRESPLSQAAFIVRFLLPTASTVVSLGELDLLFSLVSSFSFLFFFFSSSFILNCYHLSLVTHLCLDGLLFLSCTLAFFLAPMMSARRRSDARV